MRTRGQVEIENTVGQRRHEVLSILRSNTSERDKLGQLSFVLDDWQRQEVDLGPILNSNDGEAALYVAAMNGCSKGVVSKLIECGARDFEAAPGQDTALMVAARLEHSEAAIRLLDGVTVRLPRAGHALRPVTNVNAVNVAGQTALTLAVARGDMNLTMKLVERGADTNQGGVLESAFMLRNMLAIKTMVTFLVGRGADPAQMIPLGQPNSVLNSVLHNEAALSLLLQCVYDRGGNYQDHIRRLNLTDALQDNAQHQRFIRRRLARAEYDSMSEDERKMQAFMLLEAALETARDPVTVLDSSVCFIEETLGIHTSDIINTVNDNHTLLYRSVSTRPCDFISALIRLGARDIMLAGFNETSLHCAVRHADTDGGLDILRLLLQHQETLNQLNATGHTPLTLAIELGKTEAALALIDTPGCDLNSGLPLGVAVRKLNVAVVERLLQAGVSVQTVDREGINPLQRIVLQPRGTEDAGNAAGRIKTKLLEHLANEVAPRSYTAAISAMGLIGALEHCATHQRLVTDESQRPTKKRPLAVVEEAEVEGGDSRGLKSRRVGE